MNSSAMLFVAIITLICIEGTTSAVEVLKTNTVEMQHSIARCILHIAKGHFFPGSIIGVVSAGLKTDTNRFLPINTNNIIIGKLMDEMRWNMLFKRAKTYKNFDLVCHYGETR